MKNDFKGGESALILVLSFGLIGICVFLDISLVYGFAAGIAFLILFFIKKGYRASQLRSMITRGVLECRILYVLILLIGATVSIWLSSGVVPAMIYYGFEYMKGMNFLLGAFLIIGVSSIFMGTAVGTVSTIGVAVLGIGRGFGIPAHILLGVIVSAAFIADKISPISGLLNLTLTTTDTKYRETLKGMLPTLVPTLVLSGLFYYFLGRQFNIGGDTGKILEFQRAIENSFLISPYLLLMPIVIVLMSFLGVKIIYSILAGLIGGAAVSFIFQNMSIKGILNAVFFGYKGATASKGLNEILISGGVVSMLEVLVIVIGAITLSSILEGTGFISFITGKVTDRIKSKGELILKTGLISGVLTVITCDQTTGIVLPGRLLKDKYKQMNVDKTILARTISDTGTIIAPLMPWNVNALIIGLVTGIPALMYAPFAVLCFISPIVTILYAFMNSGRSKECNLEMNKNIN